MYVSMLSDLTCPDTQTLEIYVVHTSLETRVSPMSVGTSTVGASWEQRRVTIITESPIWARRGSVNSGET